MRPHHPGAPRRPGGRGLGPALRAAGPPGQPAQPSGRPAQPGQQRCRRPPRARPQPPPGHGAGARDGGAASDHGAALPHRCPGRLRPRAEKDGLPPTGRRLESPYDPEARYTRRGHRTWVGYLAHATETCDEDSINVITDVATTVPTGDSVALPGIHTRLKRRRLLPAEHLVDTGYTSVVLHDAAARTHRVTMVGPLRTNNSRQRKTGDGFARENFIIDFDHREVTCPNGQVSGNWNELPAMAPFTVVRFDKRQCGPCPEKSSCTSGAARTVNFLPQHLHELQARNRSDQQDPQWQRLYASRSGIEGTMNELVNGHRMRRCRYHGVSKAHVQHVLTAIAVNIERLSTQEPADSTYRPRSPTAFQQYLDENELPRPRWWRQGQ
ncbi:transposase [Streptomyces sp. NPDC053726]|uniref:transposase n=1 Tax=Streptomyces sp. NPDC053726 TaxID=3365713 RepID=UPI0037D0BFAC